MAYFGIPHELNEVKIEFVTNNIGAIIDFINIPIPLPVSQTFYNEKYKNIVFLNNEWKFYSAERILQMSNIFRFSGLSKNALITYWDNICRLTMEEYFSFDQRFTNGEKIKINRNTKNHIDTTTATTISRKFIKPDIMYWYKGYLIFKGEEKDESSKFDKAFQELIEKDCDFYMDFILCYAAAGPLFQFFILTKDKKLIELTKQFNLTREEDRLLVVSKSINIARLLVGQTDSLEKRPYKQL